MLELFTKLKKMVLEPKVYTLIVRSNKGQVLHLGIHFSLDEAYAVAKMKLEALVPHNPGEAMDIDLWNCIPARECIIQLFDPSKVSPVTGTVPADPQNHNLSSPNIVVEQGGPIPDEILKAIISFMADKRGMNTPITQGNAKPALKSVQDHILGVREAKNGLLKKLVENGDLTEVDKLGRLLTSYERKYVTKRITDKE